MLFKASDYYEKIPTRDTSVSRNDRHNTALDLDSASSSMKGAVGRGPHRALRAHLLGDKQEEGSHNNNNKNNNEDEDDEDEPATTVGKIRRLANNKVRWALGLAAAIILIGSFLHACKFRTPVYPRYKGEYHNFFGDRLSDNNEHFSGPGRLDEDLRFGLNAKKLEQVLETDNAAELLGLPADLTGGDVWSNSGQQVVAGLPKLVDDDDNLVEEDPVTVPTGKRIRLPGDEMLMRPEPARVPHEYNPAHPNVCLGPKKYQWNGPEEFSVNVEEFNRFYSLVSSSYISSYIRVVDGEHARDGEIVVRPHILLADRELNNIVHVTEKRNTERKSYVLHIDAPAWDRVGNGKYNCIGAMLEIVLPKDERSLDLLGAGVVKGSVDHAHLPSHVSIGSLVGWAVNGHVHVKHAPRVGNVTVAVNNGAVHAHKLAASGDVYIRSVNAPVDVSVALSGEKSRFTVKAVNSLIKAHVDESFAGTFSLHSLNGYVDVKGKNVDIKDRSRGVAEGLHKDGSQSIRLETVNGAIFVNFDEVDV